MKNINKILLTGLFALLASCQYQGGSAKTEFKSQYFLRGIPFSESAVVQSEASATFGDEDKGYVTPIVFTNVDTTTNDVNEVDFIVDYTRSIGDTATVSLSYTGLTFPNTEFEKTAELAASVSLDMLLHPTLSVVKDIDEDRGTYAALSVGHNWQFKDVGLSATLTGAWNHNHYREGSGITHVEVEGGMALPVTKGVTFNAGVMKQYSLSDAVEDATVGSVSLQWDFGGN